MSFGAFRRTADRVPPPFLPDTGSELASRAGQKPIIVSPNSKEPLRAKADANVREIFWFAGQQFVGKAAPNQVLEWTATAAITKSPRWTITVAPVRIASRCDENTRK